MQIRIASYKDLSRIAEMIVANYRRNFYPIFQNEEFYFGELNVLDTAKEYENHPEWLENTYVFEDGVVKGMIRVDGEEIVKLYVDPQFQSQSIGAKLLQYAIDEKQASWLWVLEQNERGISFYKRNGFAFTGERILEDEWIPLKKMILDIDR